MMDGAIALLVHDILTASTFPIAPFFLPAQDREALACRARQNARDYGLHEWQWQLWRREKGAQCDLLMALDPARESALIRKALGRKYARKTAGKVND